MSLFNRKCALLVGRVMQKQWWLSAMTKWRGQPGGQWLSACSIYSTNDHALADTEYDNMEISTTFNSRKSKERHLSSEKRIADIINDRIAIIQEASQISRTEASQIASLFSPIFTFSQQAIQMIRFLSGYNCDLKAILTQQPTVLGLDVQQVYDMSFVVRLCILVFHIYGRSM